MRAVLNPSLLGLASAVSNGDVTSVNHNHCLNKNADSLENE